MLKFLHTPFPRPRKSRRNILWVCIVGVAASFFILLYEPFGIRNETGEWYVYLIIFSLGAPFVLSILFMEFAIPGIFPRPFKKWTVGKAMVWYAIVVMVVSATNFLYKSYWGGFSEFTLDDFFGVFGRTLVIGITVCFFVLGIWQYLNRKRINAITSKEDYVLVTQDGKTVHLNLKNVLYIASDNNYVDVFLETNGIREKMVLRSSLSNIESQLVNPLSPISRCHRKFLINSEHFYITNDTSRNMSVGLKNYPDQVPVSSKYVQVIRQQVRIRP